jgi:hypothetical protein
VNANGVTPAKEATIVFNTPATGGKGQLICVQAREDSVSHTPLVVTDGKKFPLAPAEMFTVEEIGAELGNASTLYVHDGSVGDCAVRLITDSAFVSSKASDLVVSTATC